MDEEGDLLPEFADAEESEWLLKIDFVGFSFQYDFGR